mgnify:CR=1 FL=1
MSSYRQILVTGLLLFAFAAIGTSLVAVTYEQTRDQIQRNERQVLRRQLNQVINPERYDNNLLQDRIEVSDPALGVDGPVTVYRARMQGIPVAAVFRTVAPDGYNGRIRLLVGVDVNGVVTGVRALSHRETPGLGDAIEAGRSDWILGFAGRRLGDPPEPRWTVKRDGGAFDQFTGATITPRAVVGAIRRTLVYFEAHRKEIFARPTLTDADADQDAETHDE